LSKLNDQQLHQYLSSLTSSKSFLIAYSGGLDSHVLLHLMKTISQTSDINIRALYVNHGLQKEADSWAKHCQKICQNMQIPFDIVKLTLDLTTGESIEAVARNGRYQVLKKSLQKDEVLLTAHHQNDQAETLLLQLFRGAGVDGLAAMPKIAAFGLGQQLRPLLSFNRNELADYAQHHHLTYIEDPSNQDQRFDRNYLRHHIYPLLQQRWQGITKVLARTTEIQAETAHLLDELAAEDFDKIVRTSGYKNNNKDCVISITALMTLSAPRQKLVLRYWIKQHGFLMPSAKKLQHLFKDVIHSKQDASPLLTWQGVEVRRFQNRLYIMSPLNKFDSTQVIRWNIKTNIVIPELDLELQADALKVLLKNQKKPDKNTAITVRFRNGGEKLFDVEKRINVSLKNYFQDGAIPPWQRSRIPLIYLGETLIHVWI